MTLHSFVRCQIRKRKSVFTPKMTGEYSYVYHGMETEPDLFSRITGSKRPVDSRIS